MEYEGLGQDEKIATKKLVGFYKSLGFKQLFKNEYFFYNSALPNKKLNEVDIDI